VTIVGNFPSATYVWFGDVPGRVTFQDRGQITVETPRAVGPGIVDITLRKSHRGVVLTIPDAYAFTGGGTDDPGGTTTDGPDGGDTTGGGSSGSDGSTGGGDASDDGAGSNGDNDGSTGTDGETADRSDRRSRMAVGSPVELANGLVGGPLTPNLASGVRSCSTDPCPAVRR
jgi:hypothetical protein